MARKPKIQPILEAAIPAPSPAMPDDAAAPARRGRKPKVAALLSTSPSTTGASSPAKALGRKGPGRKPKQAAGAEIALSAKNGAAEPQGLASHEPEAETIPDSIEESAPAAAAESDPVQPDVHSGKLAHEAAKPSTKAGASNPAKPAVHWDRTTDHVQFDWPAIEQTATQDGPNQSMAKLLVAARAEGAQSRWPF